MKKWRRHTETFPKTRLPSNNFIKIFITCDWSVCSVTGPFPCFLLSRKQSTFKSNTFLSSSMKLGLNCWQNRENTTSIPIMEKCWSYFNFGQKPDINFVTPVRKAMLEDRFYYSNRINTNIYLLLSCIVHEVKTVIKLRK